MVAVGTQHKLAPSMKYELWPGDDVTFRAAFLSVTNIIFAYGENIVPMHRATYWLSFRWSCLLSDYHRWNEKAWRLSKGAGITPSVWDHYVCGYGSSYLCICWEERHFPSTWIRKPACVKNCIWHRHPYRTTPHLYLDISKLTPIDCHCRCNFRPCSRKVHFRSHLHKARTSSQNLAYLDGHCRILLDCSLDNRWVVSRLPPLVNHTYPFKNPQLQWPDWFCLRTSRQLVQLWSLWYFLAVHEPWEIHEFMEEDESDSGERWLGLDRWDNLRSRTVCKWLLNCPHQRGEELDMLKRANYLANILAKNRACSHLGPYGCVVQNST